MLSIIIPSVNEWCLQKTIDGLREKAEGQIEIIVVFDGRKGEVSSVDKVLLNEKRLGMRSTINRGMAVASGDYVMKCDEHNIFGEGFDVKLLSRIEDNWIVVPRRFKLDIDKWEVIDEPPVDYDRLIIDRPDKIGGVYWTQRKERRQDKLIDETMVHQGSCYVMSRKHWGWLGGLQTKGYGEFAQEAIEISLKTWLGGGKVMVNKLTWYAHKHRRFRRVVHISSKDIEDGNKYSQDFWLNNRWEGRIHDLSWLMRRFGLKCTTSPS